MGEIPVREFTSGAEVLAAAKVRHYMKRAQFDSRHQDMMRREREARRRAAAEKIARLSSSKAKSAEIARLEREEMEARERLNRLRVLTVSAQAKHDQEMREREEFLRSLGLHNRLNMITITKRICKAMGVDPVDIVSARRTNDVAFARHAIMYWARRLTTLSYPQIGSRLGGRDHSTALHGAAVYPEKRARQGRYLRPVASCPDPSRRPA